MHKSIQISVMGLSLAEYDSGVLSRGLFGSFSGFSFMGYSLVISGVVSGVFRADTRSFNHLIGFPSHRYTISNGNTDIYASSKSGSLHILSV
jgi:hypothetical protein